MQYKILSPLAITIFGLLFASLAAFISWNREHVWLTKACFILVIIEIIIVYPISQLEISAYDPGLLEVINALSTLASMIVLIASVVL